MVDLVRRCFPEFVGTAVLVFFGVGAAVFGFNVVGVVGVALSFGLVLLGLVYAIGPRTGCHVNPAITLGILLSRGITLREACGYWVAQLLGAIAGAALIRGFTGFGDVKDQTGTLGSNDWGKTINGPGAFLLEIILTLLLVTVVLLVTGRAASPGFAGLAIGLTLTVCHLVGIPLDGTSVNPARSIGPAIFNGGIPLQHVWLFIVAPLIGGVIAAVLAPALAATAPAPVSAADRDEVESSEARMADPTGAE